MAVFCLDQKTYVKKVLVRFSMSKANLIATAMLAGFRSSSDNADLRNEIQNVY